MTPQSNFMVLAPVDLKREAELRRLLASMNEASGRVNANNVLLPFGQFDTLHFARLLILDDKTGEDVRVYGLSPRTYPLYLAFLGDVDGDEDVFLNEQALRAPDGLRALFSCCQGFSANADLLDWMKQHRSPSIANYVNCRGRTVRQVREEAALRDALDSYLACHASTFHAGSPKEIHRNLQEFTQTEKSSGRLTLTGESPTPIGWGTRNGLHFIGGLVLLLLALPLLLVAAPFYLLRLR